MRRRGEVQGVEGDITGAEKEDGWWREREAGFIDWRGGAIDVR